MPKLPLKYFCYVCGHQNDLKLKISEAPKIDRQQVKCSQCGDVTHLLTTACPKCKKSIRYFLADLDFPTEMTSLSQVYVDLISGIRDSLKDHIKDFKVPVPKKWTVNLECECGHKYQAQIDLPQLE
ncbi:MAG: hypothetical protein ACP6KW_09970 [Candidatus Thorarchaeota archaeon]